VPRTERIRAGSARSTANQRPPSNTSRRPLAGNQRSPIGGGANDPIPGLNLPSPRGPRTPDRRYDRRPAWQERNEKSGEIAIPDTGEPKIVQKVRAQFATWLAVNGGLFLMNVATTQLDPPWFLFPAAGMGIGLLSNYSKLWQAGYSWRDVLRRPAAPDSIESSRDSNKGLLAKVVPAPPEREFGEQYPLIRQVHGDRAAIFKLVERLPSLRVVFISGAASPADLHTIARKKAVLLEKPFSAEMLASIVRELLS